MSAADGHAPAAHPEEAAYRAWLAATRDEPLESMAGFFDARAGGYEAHMARWARHYAWMAALLPPDTAELLDVGCGSGLELDYILPRFPRLRVTGVDLSAQLLRRLREKHPDRALTLVQADYTRFDLGRDRFDAAIAFETLHHLTYAQKTTVLARIRQSLRPGGCFLCCDYIAATQAIEELALAECARRRRRDGIADGAFVHFDIPLTAAHELQALQSAGFRDAALVGLLDGDANTALFRARR